MKSELRKSDIAAGYGSEFLVIELFKRKSAWLEIEKSFGPSLFRKTRQGFECVNEI